MDKLIPGWFTERMTTDQWFFGLLTTSGELIAINTITNIYQAKDGTIWIDVEMLEKGTIGSELCKGFRIIFSPTSRTTASINTKNIIAAFELSDT